MKSINRYALLTAALVVLALIFTACQAPPQDNAALDEAENQIATLQAQIEEGAENEGVDTSELEQQLADAQATAQALIDAAAEQGGAAEPEEGDLPSFEVEFKNPDTYTHMRIAEPATLDPAVAYDAPSAHVLNQVYDRLIFYNEGSTEEFVPMLATEWEVSEDGLTYVFTIREGVTFHEGGTLEPHDVAYTFHRNMMTGWDFSDLGGPMGLFFDPMFGVPGIGFEGDGGLADLAGNDDVAICEMIMSGVVADDEAGTVTITLNYPASYFPQLLAQYWGGVQDMEWMVEQGAWDGSCDTWREWYGLAETETTLFNVVNGTGPYKLDHWTAGDEVVLTANEDWWLTEPLWEGSSIDGTPEIDTIVIKLVEEWGTRLAAFEAGDADQIDGEIAFASQIEPMVNEWIDYQTGEVTINNENGFLRLYSNLPNTDSTDMFFNQQINTEGGNQWIGSGELDGNGIPADFFADEHVRKAFSYCFDRDTFIADVRQGEAIPHRGPFIAGMPGYTEDSEIPQFDLDACAAEFEQAFDGQLMETGFRITLVYNSGNDSRRIAAEILKANIETISPNFVVIIANLPFPTYLAERRADRFPIHTTGWIQDYNHPHNWAVPYMSCSGDFSSHQGLPEDLCGSWDELMQQAVRESDPEAAAAIYEQLQAEAVANFIDIWGFQPTGRAYLQMWIDGYYFNPAFGDEELYYAALTKVAP